MEHTFTLTITGTEHGEWQGQLTGPDAVQTEFHSVLEMLKLIKEQVDDKKA